MVFTFDKDVFDPAVFDVTPTDTSFDLGASATISVRAQAVTPVRVSMAGVATADVAGTVVSDITAQLSAEASLSFTAEATAASAFRLAGIASLDVTGQTLAADAPAAIDVAGVASVAAVGASFADARTQLTGTANIDVATNRIVSRAFDVAGRASVGFGRAAVVDARISITGVATANIVRFEPEPTPISFGATAAGGGTTIRPPDDLQRTLRKLQEPSLPRRKRRRKPRTLKIGEAARVEREREAEIVRLTETGSLTDGLNLDIPEAVEKLPESPAATDDDEALALILALAS